jgi:hypothetical protein
MVKSILQRGLNGVLGLFALLSGRSRNGWTASGRRSELRSR